MNEEVYERAAWLVTTIAVFGLGVWLGGRACGPDPIVNEKVVVEEKVVEVCREDCGDVPQLEESAAARPERTIGKPAADPLPAANRRLVPAKRKKLLAWVKERSREDLEECRQTLTEVARITVTVVFREERLPRASVNAAEGDLPAQVVQCVERHVASWSYPEELIEGQTEILFGLRL